MEVSGAWTISTMSSASGNSRWRGAVEKRGKLLGLLRGTDRIDQEIETRQRVLVLCHWYPLPADVHESAKYCASISQ